MRPETTQNDIKSSTDIVEKRAYPAQCSPTGRAPGMVRDGKVAKWIPLAFMTRHASPAKPQNRWDRNVRCWRRTQRASCTTQQHVIPTLLLAPYFLRGTVFAAVFGGVGTG